MRFTSPVCVTHACEMRCVKTGVLVLVRDDGGRPYEIHAGDRFACPMGSEEVVVNWAREAVVQHWQPEFAGYAERTSMEVSV